MILKGSCALITGGGQGLGLAVARAFLAEGAGVMICGRDRAVLKKAAAELRADLPPGARLEWRRADVGREADLERLFRDFSAEFPRLDILVNNAGVFGPIGPLEEASWKGWVAAIRTNLFGTANACRLALPLLRARRRAPRGKIINLSGGGATNPMPNFSAYAASKAAVVRLTETLAEETASRNIDVNAVAPGPLNTRLMRQLAAAGPRRAGKELHTRARATMKDGGAPLERAAALCVFLASRESDGLTGRLLSAVWDPWRTLAARRAQIRKSDVYTLRRIRPEDRGLGWKTSRS